MQIHLVDFDFEPITWTEDQLGRAIFCHEGKLKERFLSEPDNVEDVRIRVFPALERAIVTYRGRGVDIEIPTRTNALWVAG